MSTPTVSPATPSSRTERTRGVGPVERGGVGGVVAADDVEEQGGVGHGGGQGPDLVQRAGEGHQAVAGHGAVGGLHAHHPAQGGGLADRAPGVGAQGARGRTRRPPRRPIPPTTRPAPGRCAWGLRVGPKAEPSVEEPMANSSMLVFPTTTAPARRSRVTTVAS